jgi:hypothetical protein
LLPMLAVVLDVAQIPRGFHAVGLGRPSCFKRLAAAHPVDTNPNMPAVLQAAFARRVYIDDCVTAEGTDNEGRPMVRMG